MKNQNKILMSLLTASVSALTTAPALAATNDKNGAENIQEGINVETNFIDLKKIVNVQMADEQIAIKNDIKLQVEAMLNKKAPIMKISESIDVVVDNYGKDDETIKKQVFDDLQLGASGAQDSTTVSINASAADRNGGARATCHATCHVACHGACHGSRGWR